MLYFKQIKYQTLDTFETRSESCVVTHYCTFSHNHPKLKHSNLKQYIKSMSELLKYFAVEINHYLLLYSNNSRNDFKKMQMRSPKNLSMLTVFCYCLYRSYPYTVPSE